jgi:hypothetical protein
MYCTHKEKVRLTSGVAYLSSESFALWDGNIVYNHHLFLEDRPICSKLRNPFSYKNQDIQSDDKQEKKKHKQKKWKD